MNIQRSTPILINTGSRVRRDTIESIKESPASYPGQSDKPVPGLGASTPPSFIPDGSYKHTRVDSYDILEQLEGHNSGNVYRAVNIHNDLEFVCKVYDRSEYGKLISIYHRIDKHPNINFIADKVVQPTKVYVFYQPGQAITSEILPKTFKADNLHNYIRSKVRIPEDVAACLFTQIVAAISHCHKNNVVVKDLKLRKFIFQDPEKKRILLECIDDAHVLENGDERIAEDGKAFPAYVSPEMILYLKKSKSKEAEFNGKSRDVWRLGIMLYTMLVGCYPFKVEDKKVMAKIFHCQYTIPSSVSPEASDLIRHMLKRQPSQRIAAEDILYHPWIKCKGKFLDPNHQMIPLGCGGESEVVDEIALNDLKRFPHSYSLPASLFSQCTYADQIVPDIDDQK